MRNLLIALAGLVAVGSGCHAAPRERALRAEPVRAGSADRSITLTYLGVAGWSLSDGANTLLFDPYVTRVAVADMEQTLAADLAAIERFTPARADVIAVSHSHFDHVLDVPDIAKRSGATVLGTRGTATLARAAGVPETQIAVVSGGDELTFGPFRVRAVAALHSLTGQRNLPIAPHPQLPLRAREYRESGTLQYLVSFSGHAIYFIGTANFLEAQLRGLQPDVAIVAVGLHEKVPDFTCRLLRALGWPALVLPNHFDVWQEPLHTQMTLAPEVRAGLRAFAAEVHACAPQTRVVTPVWLQPIEL